jgi:hypothetical protein
VKVYVASSWRNERQPKVVKQLREAGHEVYDFHNPEPGNNGFHWSEIDPIWQEWSPEKFKEALNHPIAAAGFALDFRAMRWAEAFVLVLPCGRSAHLELGWAAGQDKVTIVLLAQEPQEPELMYKLADHVCVSIRTVREILAEYEVKEPAIPHQRFVSARRGKK